MPYRMGTYKIIYQWASLILKWETTMDNKCNLFFLIILLFGFSQFSSANDICADLPSENNIEDKYDDISKFWKSNVVEGIFHSTSEIHQEKDHKVNTDIIIAFAKLERKPGAIRKGSIVISNGRTETYLKYKEMAVTLWCRGFSVYMMDHRGQGLSIRILIYNESSKGAEDAYSPTDYENRGHVEVFDNYVNDLKTFVEKEAGIPKDAPKILLAHSMGGGIAARLIQKYPKLFSVAILSSPMLDIPSRTIGCRLVDYLLEEKYGEDAYAPGGERWNHCDRYPYRDTKAFYEKVGKYYTSSSIRHNLWHQEYENVVTTVDGRDVDLRIGSATNGWFDQACTAVDEIGDDIGKIEIPVLVLIAENDEAVPPKKQVNFCEKLAKSSNKMAACDLIVIENARHEMFIEADAIRDKVLDHIYNFIEKTL